MGAAAGRQGKKIIIICNNDIFSGPPGHPRMLACTPAHREREMRCVTVLVYLFVCMCARSALRCVVYTRMFLVGPRRVCKTAPLTPPLPRAHAKTHKKTTTGGAGVRLGARVGPRHGVRPPGERGPRGVRRQRRKFIGKMDCDGSG